MDTTSPGLILFKYVEYCRIFKFPSGGKKEGKSQGRKEEKCVRSNVGKQKKLKTYIRGGEIKKEKSKEDLW